MTGTPDEPVLSRACSVRGMPRGIDGEGRVDPRAAPACAPRTGCFGVEPTRFETAGFCTACDDERPQETSHRDWAVTGGGAEMDPPGTVHWLPTTSTLESGEAIEADQRAHDAVCR